MPSYRLLLTVGQVRTKVAAPDVLPAVAGVVAQHTTVEAKDKILVTKMTDPGWVFLITLAKGIITEKGSLLSHTAIISRELNIPSIVGVKNITNILKTGDVVRMNGGTGKIEVVRKSDG